VAVSNDGNTVAVGSDQESGGTPQVFNSGAAYIFTRSSGWKEQAYIKASKPGVSDNFGNSIALSGDGTTLSVGAMLEDSSNRIGVNTTTNENAIDAGAVYVFTFDSTVWSQKSFIKAKNAETTDRFGSAVGLDNTGNIMAVGAYNEDGKSIGVNQPINNGMQNAGAVYLY